MESLEFTGSLILKLGAKSLVFLACVALFTPQTHWLLSVLILSVTTGLLTFLDILFQREKIQRSSHQWLLNNRENESRILWKKYVTFLLPQRLLVVQQGKGWRYHNRRSKHWSTIYSLKVRTQCHDSCHSMLIASSQSPSALVIYVLIMPFKPQIYGLE